ncbi:MULTISPECIES: NAD(P)-dependent oxidoreductase [Oceanobacillus]|uniref:Oxidoreductase n=1 Tax=Oceanobacillus kimchii TaxID=746691 RepID=A0ABQ5TFS3_9BACI|nr:MULTISPECIES: NAD(P)-dependent oxidoreductase [Oceanobacillus]MBT2652827.1 NAD(P)-dependent oxidoreductase [Oceanobacillus sp. ISL-73]MCT1577371.1 NAD(P)-dependent oxidoreductase [Oceanobacillus kimchii]MCT2136977.1 NAD(P)-dependent oxidoreductase [Oceanobacillus kimchii]OEH53574.1 oxidoreductase [Oceanobacillus sp. E9]GLO64912.1 oxidoreductase [Oceanobacillus kimchii]
MLSANTTTIGFIGTGVMGKSMAKNLINAGYYLRIFTRTKSKADDLLNIGAKWDEDIPTLAKQCDVIITMVGYPSDVEEVYLGDQGLIKNCKEGSYLIDMTTSKPSLAEEIFSVGKKHGLYVLDAPVSGGDIGAESGTLAIMTGGERSVYDYVLPVFQVLGENISYQGPAGAGQHTKMSNQITIASNMIGVCESLLYAKKAGLDAKKVLATISTGAAASFSLSKLGARMLENDFAPGFYVKHFIKDMKIALESSQDFGLDTPGLKLAIKLYEELANMGEQDSGTQALIKTLAYRSEMTV